MNNKPLEREPVDRMRARLEALLKAKVPAEPNVGVKINADVIGPT